MMKIATGMFTRKVNSQSFYAMLLSSAVMLSIIRYQTTKYIAITTRHYDHPSRQAHMEAIIDLPQHQQHVEKTDTNIIISAGPNVEVPSSISMDTMLTEQEPQQQHEQSPSSSNSTSSVANREPELIPPYQTDNLLVQQGDSIYLRQGWDAAPIVIEKYKLIFFTTAKVGCTVWKQLFRRIMGYKDWKAENTKHSNLPWNPEANGLKYLYHYNRTQASEMMSSPEWTRAIFVRDPKERFLSAYLDKVVSNPYFTRRICCPHKKNCISNETSLEDFIELAQTCENNHWAPQSRRMEPKYWQYINFVGHMDTIAVDAERLLRQVGGDECWDKYGATGWGKAKKGNNTKGKRKEEPDHAIFASTSTGIGTRHATAAKDRLQMHYTPELERKVDEYCAGDYHVPVMNLTKRQIFAES